MMKKILLLLSLALFFYRDIYAMHQQPSAAYHYKINLHKVDKHQLSVELRYSGHLPDTAYFYFPKIVPGIYDDLDYGKYVTNLRAKDVKGRTLNIKRVDTGCWKIVGAPKQLSIEYDVREGWHEFDNKDIKPYRSSETHFDSTLSILNANAVFGYFHQQENTPFYLTVERNPKLFGATSLTKTNSSENEDSYYAPNYKTLVDNPIMYSLPDTALIELPNITVTVACYSRSQKKIAAQLAEYIAPLVKNQTDYLGGKLATDKYTFIIYHYPNYENANYVADGLEHNQSTLILLYTPLDIEILKDIVFGIASHEFFHTQVPLALHAYEIADFDFNHPKLSKHLWLYEGLTEYFTIHMPIKQKMQSLETFIHTLERKIADMKKFDNSISFTYLSRNALHMQDQYMNVYLKGALINLCLDIELRSLSNGQYGVQQLIAELSQKYGKDKPFHDDELFQDIYQMTGFPEIKTFIEQYIEGSQPLPLTEELEKVGLHLDSETGKISEITQLSESQATLRKQWINQ